MEFVVGLVELVESGNVDSEQAREVIGKYVRPMIEADVDHIVLGCTHYPFLEKLIREFAGEGVEIVNPAPAVARRVAQVLQGRRKGMSVHKKGASGRFITTGDNLEVMEKMVGEIAGGAAENFVFEKKNIL